MLDFVYLNGEHLNRQDANLHLSDLSILRGYGIFDFFRYVEGKPRFLEDHLDRFERSAKLIGLPLPLDRAELTEVVHQLIERNEPTDGGIRFVLTGGYAEDGYTPDRPNLMALPYAHHDLPETWFRDGCRVFLHRYERQLPQVKTIDYIEGIRIQPLLKAAQAQYPLYVDRHENIRESDRSNFMIVKNDSLIAPVDDILLGVTRLNILRMARSMGVPVEERAVSVAEFLAADEAIMCSSVKGVLGITSTANEKIADGKVGPLTRRLMEAWEEYLIGR